MIRHLMRAVLFLLAGVGALYVAMLGVFFLSKDACIISPIVSFPSPSMKLAVEVENRSCRGEGTATRARLRRPLSPSSPERAVSTELWTSAPMADTGTEVVQSSPVQAVWMGESKVRAMVPRGTRPTLEREFDGVMVVYEER